MRFTETYQSDLSSTEYRLDFWGLDFDKLQEYVKKNGSRTVPLDVLNDAVTRYGAKTLVSDEFINMAIQDEAKIKRYIRSELLYELAENLIKQVDEL